MTPEQKRNYMLDTPLPKLIMAMAAPTIAANVINTLYNLADTYFVSRLGTYATAAVGVNATVDQIIMMAGSLLAIGSASFVSRLLGAREDKKAENVLSTSFFTAIATGALVLILGTVFMEPMLRLFGATENVMPYAKQYATYVLLAAPFMASTFVLNQCLRAEGSATLSMIGTVTGAVLNVGLDPIFIFVLDMGVTGASIATAISKLVSFSILLYPYLRGKALLRIRLKLFKITREAAGEVIRMGSSSLLRNLLAILCAMVLNNLAGRYSDSALAAISVVNRLSMLFASICLGFGMGFQPVVGFCWGAKVYSRIPKAYYTASRMLMYVFVPLSVLCFIFARPIVGIFTTEDAEMLRLGTLGLRAICVSNIFHGLSILSNMMYVGIGKSLGATVMSCSRQGICLYPALLPLTLIFGVEGIACVQAVSDFLATIIAVVMARSALKKIRLMPDGG